MFWLEYQLIPLSWTAAYKTGLCPRAFGTFSLSSLLIEMWAGWLSTSMQRWLRFVMLFVWQT